MGGGAARQGCTDVYLWAVVQLVKSTDVHVWAVVQLVQVWAVVRPYLYGCTCMGGHMNKVYIMILQELNMTIL